MKRRPRINDPALLPVIRKYDGYSHVNSEYFVSHPDIPKCRIISEIENIMEGENKNVRYTSTFTGTISVSSDKNTEHSGSQDVKSYSFVSGIPDGICYHHVVNVDTSEIETVQSVEFELGVPIKIEKNAVLESEINYYNNLGYLTRMDIYKYYRWSTFSFSNGLLAGFYEIKRIGEKGKISECESGFIRPGMLRMDKNNDISDIEDDYHCGFRQLWADEKLSAISYRNDKGKLDGIVQSWYPDVSEDTWLFFRSGDHALIKDKIKSILNFYYDGEKVSYPIYLNIIKMRIGYELPQVIIEIIAEY